VSFSAFYARLFNLVLEISVKIGHDERPIVVNGLNIREQTSRVTASVERKPIRRIWVLFHRIIERRFTRYRRPFPNVGHP
jgi:hypothetical protein